MKKYKVILRGAYGAYNFGDDALLNVIYTKIGTKVEKNDIAIFGSNISYLKKHYPQSHVIDKFQSSNSKCNNLVYGGGTQFYDFGSKNRLNIDTFKLIFKPSYLLKKIKSKLIKSNNLLIDYDYEQYVCVGMGPFKSLNSKVFKNAINQMKDAAFLSVRDNKSSYYLDSNAINYSKTVDLCFSKNIKTEQKYEENSVGVILRDWDFYESEFIIENFWENLTNIKNKNIKVITFGKDIKTKDYCKRNNIDIISWDPEKMDIDDFILELSKFKILITSRFHGIVYSILLDRAVISLPIEPKLEQAAKELDGVIAFNGECLNSLIKEVEENYSNIIYRLNYTKLKNHVVANNTLNDFLDSLK